jgi:RNA methyltransferase, TrmH family
VKAARRLAKRAFRDRERAFLAEGPQAVTEAFAHGAGITDLFVTAPARTRHADVVDQIGAAGVPVHLVNDAVMSELAQTITPQGLLAICRFVDMPLDEALGSKPLGSMAPLTRSSGLDGAIDTVGRLVAVLANVRDPGNAGTVLRAADAAGADAVVFADASVDPYNAKCVRASAGSLFHLPVVVGVRVADAVGELHARGLRVVAADGRTGRSLDEPAVQADLAKPTAWLFGNEAWGLPPELLELADDAVAVPIYGKAESLNLATAAAVCLYASARSQHVNADSA